MRRLLRFSTRLSFPVVVLLLVAWVLIPAGVLATTPAPEVPTADILRAPLVASVTDVVPTADVLRGPYEFSLPVVVAPSRTTILAWMLAGIALASLLVVLGVDLSRRGLGRKPRGGGQPLEHPQ